MKPSRVLGKGLSALIPDAELGARLGDREVRLLPLTAIGLNPQQPRKLFNDNELKELADSVGQVGVLQPVLVRRLRAAEPVALLTVDAVMARAGGETAATRTAAPDMPPAVPTHCLVAGERRVRAAWLAGVREVPAIICTYEEAEALKIALLENLHRADLNPMEEAAAYRRLLEAYGATQDELAGMLAKNRSTVANTLRLLALADEIQEMVRAGELSRGHAKALLSLEDPTVRLRLARLCRTRGLSVRECEQRAQRLAVLDAVQAGVHVAQGVGDGTGLVVLAAATGVDGQGVVGAARHQALDDLLAVHAELLGELGGGGCPAEPLGQLRGGAAEPQVQFLEPPRDLHRPAVVAEVAPHLPHDRGDGERDEIRTGVDVEPDHRVDQAHPRHLDKIVARLAPALEPPGDVVGQR